MKNIYIWFSTATDVTGKNIVEGLKTRLNADLFTVTGGKTAPPANTHYVLGYGTKVREDVNLGTMKVLNHPNKIRVNRNKFKALEVMKQAGIPVAKFKKVNNSSYAFLDAFTNPVILRTTYHQGGRGLTVCLNGNQARTLLKTADNSFGYVQELIPFETEYRIHVLNGAIIHCAKKTIQTSPNASWKANYIDKIKASAEKGGISLDAPSLDLCLNVIGKDNTLPDLIVKSNKHGWCFKSVTATSISVEMKRMVKEAVAALGLDFGAVDCAIDYSGNKYVIEVNSGPGLQRGTLDAYLAPLSVYFNNEVNTQQRTAAPRTPARATSRPAGTTARSMQEEINALVQATRDNNEKLIELLSRQNG